ncbi:MAG: DUF4164 domain-containing protein [Microcystis panniformis]
MSNETITYSLESVLKEIKDSIKEVNQKIDTLQQDVNQKIDSLEKRIDERFDKVEDRLTKLEIGQADLKGDIKVLDEKIEGLKGELKGDIKVLDEKIEGLTTRVGYQEFTNRGILIALVVAVLGGAAKLFGFFPNP